MIFAWLMGSTVDIGGADIPPPQRFLPSKTALGKSEQVLVISASDAIYRGQQEHPSGAVFARDSYCTVLLDIHAGLGAKAILNIMESDNAEDIFGTGQDWIAEAPPYAITNATLHEVSRQISVPVSRRLVEFFLSTTDNAATPDVGASVGGPILVYATALSCPTAVHQ
jgi:hypothetical protein